MADRTEAAIARLRQTLQRLETVIAGLEQQQGRPSAVLITQVSQAVDRLAASVAGEKPAPPPWGDLFRPLIPFLGGAMLAFGVAWFWLPTFLTPPTPGVTVAVETPTAIVMPEPSPEVELPEAIAPEPLVIPEETEPPTIAESPGVPLPPAVLTPEQQLLMAIRERFDALLKDGDGTLIADLAADFGRNQLRLTLGDRWYDLSPQAQDRFGGDLYTQAKILDLENLRLVDRRGIILARPPVVGDQLVIVQRQRPGDP